MDSLCMFYYAFFLSQFSRFSQSAANPVFLVHKCYDDDQGLDELDIEGLHRSGGNSLSGRLDVGRNWKEQEEDGT